MSLERMGRLLCFSSLIFFLGGESRLLIDGDLCWQAQECCRSANKEARPPKC